MTRIVAIFLCVVLLICAQSVDSRGFCYRKPSGNYPNPANCRGYIACSNGHAYRMPCPANLRWNDNTKKCDWPRNVPCRVRCRDRISRSSCRFLLRHRQCRRAIVRNVFCKRTCRRC